MPFVIIGYKQERHTGCSNRHCECREHNIRSYFETAVVDDETAAVEFMAQTIDYDRESERVFLVCENWEALLAAAAVGYHSPSSMQHAISLYHRRLTFEEKESEHEADWEARHAENERIDALETRLRNLVKWKLADLEKIDRAAEEERANKVREEKALVLVEADRVRYAQLKARFEKEV